MFNQMQGKISEILLNKEQFSAVTHKTGPLLIIAGAGTGKTAVITERIKWLISKKLADPQEILALTFTEKAAREMEERVDVALPYGLPQMWITTFHAFGDRILRDEAIAIGLDPGFKLLTQAESIIFFRKYLFQFDLNYYRPLGNPHKFIEAILTHFNRLKDEDITSKDYLLWAKGQKEQKYRELAFAFQKYEELKIKEGVMDFADLISNTLLLFRRRPDILKDYQKRFKYILIDEFQDTNIAQNEISLLLAGSHANITVVGDDDQAIYRFRGAAISNIIQFRRHYRKIKVVVLSQNYRSTLNILDAAYRLIQNNNPDRLEVREKINKKLTAVRKIKGDSVEFIFTSRVENEAEEVAKLIKKIKEDSEKNENKQIYNWNDFAVLLRANQYAEPFSRAFQRYSVPYQFLGPGQLFRKSEVKDLIAYLKFLVNQDDSVALFRVMNLPIFNLSITDITSILNFSKRIGVSLYEAIQIYLNRKENYLSYLPYLSESAVNILKKILTLIEMHLKLSKSETAGQILYSFLEETGILREFTQIESVKRETEVENISKFFDKLKSYEVDHEDASIYAVVDWIDMSMELGESPLAADIDWVNNDAVNILTVHSAKGLEFQVVFLVNLVEERFPSRERREKIPLPRELIKEILPVGDYHRQEERRLFYVGLTRARNLLYLTASNYYGEAKRIRKISPFVIETLGSKVLLQKKIPTQEGKQLPLLEWKKGKEEKVKKLTSPIDYLSYSQISTFLTCPLQYKYRYVLKIPVPPSAAASFGTSVHLALQKFYSLHKIGKKLEKRDLIEIFASVWIPLGFRNKKYEDKMKKRGKKMLSLYFNKAYNPKTQIESLEKLFRIKLPGNLKVGGKIDRIDRLPNGKLEIIDYKTGKIPSQKDIDADLQMTVYAMAAEDKGIYNKPPDKVILSFYFLEESKKMTTIRNSDQLHQSRQKIIDIKNDIGKSGFSPRVGPWCDFCDFRLICEAWQ